MGKEDKEKLTKIKAHLASLYQKWADNCDEVPHFKHWGGTVEVTYACDSWFDHISKGEYLKAEPGVVEVPPIPSQEQAESYIKSLTE